MENILIINHHASIPLFGGGGRHHQFAEELSERGYNVTLISSSFVHGSKDYEHENAEEEIELNERYKYISLRTKPSYQTMFKRFLNYKDFTKKVLNYNFETIPDIIVASSVHPLSWIAGYELSKRFNAKFVIEVRDLWPLSMYEDINKYVRPFVFRYFNNLEKKYYNLASSIIVTAPNANKYINIHYEIDKESIFFVPHSIDMKQYDKQKKLTIKDAIKTNLEKYKCITYTGSLSKSEGLTTLIDIANKVRDNNNFRILIIGSGNEKKVLESKIKELKLTNVIMVDRLPRELIPAILKKSWILYCGLIERKAFEYGISKNKFYDYMAAEKPLIFMSSINDSAVEKSKGGYVVKDYSVETAVKHINELDKNIDLYTYMSKKSRLYVEENHTIQVITDKFLKAINY